MITKFNEFLNESIRDKMVGVTKEELEKATKKILDGLKDVLPGFSLTMKDLKYIIDEDDLNVALMELQDMIGQEYGDIAGVYFSGLEDPEEQWENSPTEQRLFWLKGYLELEASYQGLDDDEIDHEKQNELDNKLAENDNNEYFVNYHYHFSTGPNTHYVELFDKYTDEKGLHGEKIFEIESTRSRDIVKEVRKYLTKKQMSVLIDAMKEHHDIIILPDGKIGK